MTGAGASSNIVLPDGIRPSDGRFGSGPSRVPHEAVAALADAADGYLGTSHRRTGVRSVVARLQAGLAELFSLPEDWEVVLGNGGATGLWDCLGFGLIRRRSQHLAFGEFSAKFARAVQAVPHLEAPQIVEAPFGTHPEPVPADVDVYALTHNETSTGVQMPLRRPPEVGAVDGLVAVDATSGAGGLRWDPAEVDVYYFSPQKCFAADGGLWVACCSPAALERIAEIGDSGRWCPPTLSLPLAVKNSAANQTYNTPALATVFLTLQTVEWMCSKGGLEWAAGRCDASAETIYGWAEASDYAQPFVTEEAERSHVVATIDVDADVADAGRIATVLRANGIVDTESYRALGRNQLRISLFPAIPPGDVAALCACIDHIVARL
ncbi:MAG: phosphoserine transaminase [Acidimicrobiia bacterium]|nr:phosphoserine transaminase [Acidimicrobiia bacterium]MYC45876.1 phosphoserine transaminase [Acidimicrobiia bacterium]MYI19005.1 phosphoserine transaminase [Acidimicrobiia bacterium]